MKAIIISIKPKYLVQILNGEKTIEIRKTMPKCDLPIDVYVYCTKEEDIARIGRLGGDEFVCERYPLSEVEFKSMNSGYSAKGKVVAKFTLNKAEVIEPRIYSIYEYPYTDTLDDYNLLNKSCLLTKELEKYLGKQKGYAWFISNLEIFDKPKELSEFKSYKKNTTDTKINGIIFETELDNSLTKAPQSWCYVEV